MTEKREFSGNVGQVVMGNATGPALHLNLIERRKPVAAPHPTSCPGCNRILAATTLLLTAALLMSLFGHVAADTGYRKQNVCTHGAARYTVGGMVENPDHSLMRCGWTNGAVVWQAVELPATKSAARP